jgi:hypothetical protein
MQLFRPLAFSLVLALCSQLTAPLSAQSSNPSPDASSPFIAVSPEVQNNTDLFQFLAPIDMRSMGLSPKTPAADNKNKNDSQEMISKDEALRRILTSEENQSTCYTLRTYRVARDSPDSDSTHPAGYTTCVPSTRYGLKTAVETHEITPQ